MRATYDYRENPVADLETFRTETRAWLAANYPKSLDAPMEAEEDAPWGGRNFKPANPDVKLWLDRMADKGWTARCGLRTTAAAGSRRKRTGC